MYAVLIRLRAHWVRNLLTIVQVAVATAAVTAVLTTVLPILWQKDSGGPTLYMVRYQAHREQGVVITSAFTTDDVRFLMETAQSIEAASVAGNRFMSVIQVAGERYALRGMAPVSPSYVQVMDLDLLAGVFFTAEDIEGIGAGRVAVVSDRLARVLFGDENPIGQVINLRPDQEVMFLQGSAGSASDPQAVLGAPGVDVRVIGVYKYTGDAPLGALDTVPDLLVPAGVDLTSPFYSMAGASGSQPPQSFFAPPVTVQYMQLLVRPKPGMEGEAVHEVASLLRHRLAERRGDLPQSGLASQEAFDVVVEPVQSIETLASRWRLQEGMMSGAMGFAALITAGFAVFATTMASMSERLRTIGLARSLGATRRLVMRDVLVEAMLLSGVGGVLGALLSQPLGKYVLRPLPLTLAGEGTAAIDVVVAGLIGTALATGIGAAAAVYPAWSVARMMPAEAWREGRV